MKSLQRIQNHMPTLRESLRVASSLLMVVGQKVPFLKPCATLFLETGVARNFLQLAVPVGVTYVGTHSLSGASMAVTTAGDSKNPTTAQAGGDFQWFCQSTGPHAILSYSVSGLPPGLVFTYGYPVSSITGKATAAGSYTVNLTGWEGPEQNYRSTPVYKLNLTVTSGGVTQPEIVVQQPTGSGLVDGKAKKSFGTVKVGKSGTAKTFTIKNTGTAPLKGLTIKKSGKNAADFAVGKIAAPTLAPGASTKFKITFKPKAAGVRNAAIAIKSNDANENPFDIKLTGRAVK